MLSYLVVNISYVILFGCYQFCYNFCCNFFYHFFKFPPPAVISVKNVTHSLVRLAEQDEARVPPETKYFAEMKFRRNEISPKQNFAEMKYQNEMAKERFILPKCRQNKIVVSSKFQRNFAKLKFHPYGNGSTVSFCATISEIAPG
jgi:hypothetical protein